MTGSKYAKETRVSAAESRDELEKLLKKYSFTAFGVFTQPRLISVMFIAEGYPHRIVIPLPDPAERRFTHTEKNQARRNETDA